MIFSVYMRRRYRRDIALKNRKMMLQKNTPKGNTPISPASPKQMIFILDSSQIHPISVEIPHSLTPQKGPRSSHRRCSIGKSVLVNFAKFTGKNLCRGLFRLKACNFIEKEALAEVFSCEFCEISINTFLTEHPQAAASGVLIILCSLMETFIDVFIYYFPVK